MTLQFQAFRDEAVFVHVKSSSLSCTLLVGLRRHAVLSVGVCCSNGETMPDPHVSDAQRGNSATSTFGAVQEALQHQLLRAKGRQQLSEGA
jgi:hypothetical protein